MMVGWVGVKSPLGGWLREARHWRRLAVASAIVVTSLQLVRCSLVSVAGYVDCKQPPGERARLGR
jgi:hypothetical protein